MHAASTAGASHAVAQLNGGQSSVGAVRRSCAAPQPHLGGSQHRVAAVLTSRAVHQRASSAPRKAASRSVLSICAAQPFAVAAVAAPVAGPLSEKLGLVYNADGSVDFRVWAPVARSVAVEVVTDASAWQPPPTPPEDSGLPDEEAPPGSVVLQLARQDNDTWAGRAAPGLLCPSSAYRLSLVTSESLAVKRRDPYARSCDYHSAWCWAVDPGLYAPVAGTWTPPVFSDYLIYELHVGSFTREGTLAAAAAKLPHLAALNVTAVQLMPLCEHADAWGYNPRQLLALHGAYGRPEDMRAFVEAAHAHGIAVIVDVVLHHGAPVGNSLWNFDGPGGSFNCGGIYHEGAPDTHWGRQLALWKREVVQYIGDAAEMWLAEYGVDGLRFDSANDLPRDAVQALTWRLHAAWPGRILTAEVTPENPTSITELGFDSVWVHSGYFDIIHQHRALGRGHHGGGDWADGWNIPKLRTAMCMHFGFEQPHQCIKYLLGSHDQVGDQHGGRYYEDYKEIGGQHRYACDQYGGGRGDPHARACARLWYAANVAAAGIPMLFMGTEWAQPGWWHTSEERRLDWAHAEDEVGRQMISAFAAANALRKELPALRRGWPSMLHEDRPNGVLCFQRTFPGDERVVTVVNASRSSWQEGQYGVWVDGGSFRQVYCSADPQFGGWEGVKSNGDGLLHSPDGKLYINLPAQATLIFKQVYE